MAFEIMNLFTYSLT